MQVVKMPVALYRFCKWHFTDKITKKLSLMKIMESQKGSKKIIHENYIYNYENDCKKHVS